MMPNLYELYGMMYRSRLYEEWFTDLWKQGLISGEMHLGTGEEAIIAGVISQLQPGDALALDHRGTAALLMTGVDPQLIANELLGRPEGLCGGYGGHMHLFSKEHLAASSGIVGASGPMAVGFALAAQFLRPANVSVAFFGEGAMNQGMLLESLNLAAAWNLPIVFVCKDDNWSITTQSKSMNGGNIYERAKGFGVNALFVDGKDVEAVWYAALEALNRARAGLGPTFILATCIHLEGHFLGYQLIRLVRNPLKELPAIILPIIRAILQKGASLRVKMAGLRVILTAIKVTLFDPRLNIKNDPLQRLRSRLSNDTQSLINLEHNIQDEVKSIIMKIQQEKP